MEHKGSTDVDSIETTNYEAGDCLNLEVGDWTGTAFSYSANGSGNRTVLVVEAFEDRLVVIPKVSALEYRQTGDRDLEFEVSADGFLSNEGGHKRVKSVEHQPGRSGYHKVGAGVEQR